jgi:hypothetical protein
MMLRQAAALAILALPVVAGLAAAMPRGPVCREPSVVGEMMLQIRARDYYAKVNPALVIEQPGAAPNVVLCRVSVLSALYDMPRFGDLPVRQYKLQDFEVRILLDGFVVRALGAP